MNLEEERPGGRKYAFLTTKPNAGVDATHPKAMPVVLTTTDEVETWMTASPDEALKLQRPLPNGALKIASPVLSRKITSDRHDGKLEFRR
jgi:putative SOS response-associated peptidase YedK